MINRLTPAGVMPCFGAKKKTVPGEVSRVKTLQNVSQEKLKTVPIIDTFTSSNNKDVRRNFVNKQISHNGRNDSFTKK